MSDYLRFVLQFGDQFGHILYQDPASALNPVKRVGVQVDTGAYVGATALGTETEYHVAGMVRAVVIPTGSSIRRTFAFMSPSRARPPCLLF